MSGCCLGDCGQDGGDSDWTRPTSASLGRICTFGFRRRCAGLHEQQTLVNIRVAVSRRSILLLDTQCARAGSAPAAPTPDACRAGGVRGRRAGARRTKRTGLGRAGSARAQAVKADRPPLMNKIHFPATRPPIPTQIPRRAPPQGPFRTPAWSVLALIGSLSANFGGRRSIFFRSWQISGQHWSQLEYRQASAKVRLSFCVATL